MALPSRLPTVAALLALGLVLTACGRRGDPEFVSEERAAAPPAAGSLVAPAPRATEPVKPKQPFVLDRLL
ncbi:LPS translocon maturation chaperone LptM [Prosthecomicrobium sp. N25]|uniref:LPS translocon maturation chaperone LptM n=1 Tax=Prosthecomicrobium sp. N25 TaxID=3129254 RepID=UPI003076D551